MKIQINTDQNIEGNERVQSFLEQKISDALARFESHITRVELHLSDENSIKNGPDDIRCLFEVRLEGLEPLAVTANADTIEAVVSKAIDKVK
ncbi:MAG: HPF/RaiA family ribosome-associated protein, partial [Pedobacter sp.]